MKISVIIPVYNTEKYLGKCVNSVLSQIYQDIEVILVDDGSPDNAPKICDEFAEKDSRIVVIHQENGGLSDARNSGLKVATGEYVVFLDSDDFYIDRNAIENWVQNLKKFRPDVLIFRSKKFFQRKKVYSVPTEIFIDENQIYEHEKIMLLMQKGLFQICAWDKVVSRNFLLENNINFVLKQHSEDMEWCIKILYANPKICVDKQVYHAYRTENSASITANASLKAIVDVSNIIQKYASNHLQLSIEQILVNQFVANIYVQWLNLSTFVSKKEIAVLLKKMSRYQYLLRFNAYPYVYKTNKFKIVGFNLLRIIIHFYYILKNI